jgi:hypothetical protein
MAHWTFQGLRPTAARYSPRDFPHEERTRFEDSVKTMVSRHLTRVVGILLYVLAEVQADFRFDGAHQSAVA